MSRENLAALIDSIRKANPQCEIEARCRVLNVPSIPDGEERGCMARCQEKYKQCACASGDGPQAEVELPVRLPASTVEDLEAIIAAYAAEFLAETVEPEVPTQLFMDLVDWAERHRAALAERGFV